MTMSKSGVVAAAGRVPIPSGLRKTIQDIKEIAAGKHSDDDIYAMLKECNMDPNETAQRLLYLDTFHEVKRKCDKKKAHHGARSGRESYSLSNVSDDSGGRRQVTPQQNNRFNNYSQRKPRPSAAVVHEREKNATASALNSSTALTNGPKNASNGGFIYEAASQVSFDNNKGNKFLSAAGTNQLHTMPPLPNVAEKQLPSVDPGPTAPPPTSTSTFMPGIRSEGVIPASLPGVHSSASDPILIPSLSPQNPGAVGTIKRETGIMGNATEPISVEVEGKLNGGQDTASETENFSAKTRPSIPEDGWQAKPVYGPSKVMASQAETMMLEPNISSLPKLSDPVLDQLSPELDRKLDKLSLSAHQPVIFPDHLQVPEALRKALTFGSLDATSGQSANFEKAFMPTSENISANDIAGREHSKSNNYASSTDKDGENSNCPPIHPQVSEKLSTLGDNASLASKYDQPKQDMVGLKGELQYPLLQTAPEYSFGFVPPVLGPHPVHLEGSEPQGSNSISPPVTQPSGLGQSSFPIPLQLLPYFRQPYHPNFVPYNPQFHQLYMHHNAHQFLGHGVLPQQTTAGNIYVPPITAVGVKFPIPPLYKPGPLAGNLHNFGLHSGYGSYGSSTVGPGPSPPPTSNSGGNEDLSASEFKENNIHPTLKQNEESHSWTFAPGRDLSTLHANYFYNIPAAQHGAFPPAHSGHGPFAGMYHLSQNLAASSTGQSLPKQSQPAAAPVESLVTTSTYQQPPAQINWNTKTLDRESI